MYCKILNYTKNRCILAMDNLKYIICVGLILTNAIYLYASRKLNDNFFNSLQGDWISSKVDIKLDAELDRDTHLYAESISQFYKSIQKLDDSIYIRSYMINNFDDSILNAYQLSYNYSFSELSFIEYDEFFKVAAGCRSDIRFGAILHSRNRIGRKTTTGTAQADFIADLPKNAQRDQMARILHGARPLP